MNIRDDARKLKPAAQHMLRRQVVNAVRDGMRQVEVANLFDASLRAVNKWVALDKLGGLRALIGAVVVRVHAQDRQNGTLRRCKAWSKGNAAGKVDVHERPPL